MSRVSEALGRAAEQARSEGADAAARPPASRSSMGSASDGDPHTGPHQFHNEREAESSERRVAQPTRGRPALKELSRPYDDKLVISEEASPLCRDQYRALAATLQDIQERSKWPGTADSERGLKTLLVTSALPHEGKSLTAVNLALTLAGSFGRRVLLIDANLRRPAVHHLLRLPDSTGLSEMLHAATPRLTLQLVLPLLSVLPAGQNVRDTHVDLTGEAMSAVLKQSASDFDWVLVDAPSVGCLPDAGGLADLVRAVLLIIRGGGTSRRAVDRAIGKLGRSTILGTVLNHAEENT